MRRGIVLVVAATLVLTLGLPAGADRPAEEVTESLFFQCEISGELGVGFVSVEVFDGFAFGDAAIWSPGSDPFEGQPDLISIPEEAEASLQGDEVTATLLMMNTDDDTTDGTLHLVGSIGDQIGQESFQDRFRDGNRWVEIDETHTSFEATGVVDLDGNEFGTSCFANHAHTIFYSTNPHALRLDFEDAFLSCSAMAASDDSTLFLFAGEFEGGAFLDMQVFPPGTNPEEDVPELFGFADMNSLGDAENLTVPLFAPFDGEEPVDQALVEMTVTEGDVVDSDIVFQNARVKELATELLVTGTVSLGDGRIFDLDDCSGARFEVKGIFTNPAGPKAKGKAPANDAPSGAEALEANDRINQHTRATTFEPEGACLVAFPDEEPFNPMGKTVWYSIEGTGDTVTLDTAGSDFDTVVAVYEADGDLTDPLECVDDVADGSFTLQARVAWDTEPGTSYLVQVGGFGGEHGLLKVSTSG